MTRVRERYPDLPVYLLIFFACLIVGSGLVLSSSFGLKRFLAVVIGFLALSTGMMFKDLRFYAVGISVASVAFGVRLYPGKLVQQRALSLYHHGGALPTVVIQLVDISILVIGCMWVFDIGTRAKKTPEWTRFDTAVLVFLSLSLFSVYNTTEYTLFVYEVLRYAKYYLLYWILRTYIDKPFYYWGCLCIILLTLGMHSVVAFAQYFLFFTVPVAVGGVTESTFELTGGLMLQRVTGLLGHTNTFAAYLLFPVLSAFILLFARISFWYKAAALFSFLIGSVSLVLTFSRNGWLSLVLSLMLVVGVVLSRRRLSVAILVFLLSLTVFSMGMLFGFGFGDTVLNIASGGRTHASNMVEVVLTRIFYDTGKAFDSRWDLLNLALNMIKEHPILGIGLNTFEENMAIYDTTGVTNIIEQPVHNIYMLVAAETGIPSMIAFIIAGGILIRYAHQLLKKPTETAFVIGAIGVCTSISLGFSNLFDLTLRKDPLIGMTVVISSLVLSLYTQKADPLPDQRQITPTRPPPF